MSDNNISNRLIAKKMIDTAINLDGVLVEILRIEVKKLKQFEQKDNAIEELQRTNNLIKNVIMALTLSDEKIRTGIDLYHMSDNEPIPK